MTFNHGVVGSSPTALTNFGCIRTRFYRVRLSLGSNRVGLVWANALKPPETRPISDEHLRELRIAIDQCADINRNIGQVVCNWKPSFQNLHDPPTRFRQPSHAAHATKCSAKSVPIMEPLFPQQKYALTPRFSKV